MPRGVVTREQIAKAVDPESFEEPEHWIQKGEFDARRADAWSAADRILDLFGKDTSQ